METELIGFDLAAVRKLQQIDLAIAECLRREEALPCQIEALDGEIAARQQEMEAEKGKLGELQAARKSAELEVEALRGKISHYKDQLLSVKTNREYAALLKEIDAAEKRIDSIEETIIGYMIEVDEHNAHIKKIEAWFQSERSKLLAVKAGIEAELAETKRTRTDHERARAGVEETLPEDVRLTYGRVKAVRGVALAEARDEFCMECHVRLRPQVYNDIKMNARLITCESCNRILYYDGPPPPPEEPDSTFVETAGEESPRADASAEEPRQE